MEFYERHGVVGKTAKELDAIMKQGFKEAGDPPELFDDSVLVLTELSGDYKQVLVTGYDSDMLATDLKRHDIARFFIETHGRERNKPEKFREIMKRHGVSANEAVGVTDSIGDVHALTEVGVRSLICPRGFHGEVKITTELAGHSSAVVIPDLFELLAHL